MKLTYANAMATVALLVVVGGTAHAAVRINSAKVANNSLLAKDVKRGGLTMADLSPATKRGLVGPRGDQGRTGSKGSTGTSGADGAPGDRGSAGS